MPLTARLIVRRVRRLNPDTAATGQGELFPGHRHHTVFTDSGLSMLQAEATNRDHAIIEQVIADLKSSALAHLPSGRITANAAWTAIAAIAYTLTRAAGAAASTFHARARTATIRHRVITLPGHHLTAAAPRPNRRPAVERPGNPADHPWEPEPPPPQD